jgi:hypothetical protein
VLELGLAAFGLGVGGGTLLAAVLGPLGRASAARALRERRSELARTRVLMLGR